MACIFGIGRGRDRRCQTRRSFRLRRLQPKLPPGSPLSTAGVVFDASARRRKQRELYSIQEASPRLAELCVRKAGRLGLRRRMGSFLTWSVTSEVFVVVSLTLFLPICLEQFARDNGYYEPDHKTRCASAVITAEEARCVVKIGWAWIDTASFRCASRYPYIARTDPRGSLYTNSISVALQALTVISMGEVADHRE